MSDMDSSWMPYVHRQPPTGVLVEFRQMVSNISPQPHWIGYREELGPEMNVACLHWRLTGIGREELDGMCPEQRVQREQPGMFGALGISGILGRQPGNIGSFAWDILGL